jgi:hypothetical protein
VSVTSMCSVCNDSDSVGVYKPHEMSSERVAKQSQEELA